MKVVANPHQILVSCYDLLFFEILRLQIEHERFANFREKSVKVIVNPYKILRCLLGKLNIEVSRILEVNPRRLSAILIRY